MYKLAFVLLAFLSLSSVTAYAAANPCRFGGSNEEETSVDISSIYRSADLVVIGKVIGRDASEKDLVFQNEWIVKGMGEKTIILHGQRATNTNINGFVLPADRLALLFLKMRTQGVYENVEDFNSPCNITFFVNNKKVIFIERDEHNQGLEMPVDNIRKFLDSNPQRLIYKYQ